MPGIPMVGHPLPQLHTPQGVNAITQQTGERPLKRTQFAPPPTLEPVACLALSGAWPGRLIPQGCRMRNAYRPITQQGDAALAAAHAAAA